jgi:hypothetical protein
VATQASLSIQSLNMTFKVVCEIPLKTVSIASRNIFPERYECLFGQCFTYLNKRSHTVPNQRIMRMWGDSQRILLTKFLRLPGHIGHGIVYMNDETMSNGFRMKLKNWLQDMFDTVDYIKLLSFWKDFDNVKPRWIHAIMTAIFWRESCIFHFNGWFAIQQSDDFVICR